MAKRLRHASLSSDAAGLQEHAAKYTTLEDRPTARNEVDLGLRCDLHSQTVRFNTPEQYEAHYRNVHLNRCRECRRNFPSAHVLELHIAEQHDAFQAARQHRGEKVYACFVEDCDKVCSDWKKRRSHLIDKHGYPRNFDFLVVTSGIDGRKSLLRPGVDADGHRQSSRERGLYQEADQHSGTLSGQTEHPTNAEVEVAECNDQGGQAQPQDQVSVAELTSSMSTLRMVPRQVQFGRGRAGLSAQ